MKLPSIRLLTLGTLGLMAGAADPMMLFPAGTTFTPYSVMRNVGDTPLSITPTIWWMEGGAPHSAQLPKIELMPLEAQSLDLMSSLSSFGPKNFNGSFNLVLDTNAKPGSLLLASGSVDQTNTYVFEVTPRGVGESASKSLQYWNIGNGDDTMVTVWNPADEAQDFIFTLFFSGGHYALPLRLEPRATRMFNISEIIHNQVPDAEGNVIPVSVQEGSAKISGSRAENESILVAIDAGTFNVRKATCSPTCMWCYGNVQTKVVDNPFTTTVNGTKQLSFISTWGSGAQYNLTNSASWTTGNAPVATVQTGLVTGVAPGTVTISASASNQPIQVYICSMTAVVCPVVLLQGGDPGTVKPTLTIQGNNYVYIGHDAQVTQHTNAQFGSGTPSGGTYSWSSPDSSISFDNSSAATTHITATNYSGGTNDTSIVLNYSLNGTPATPVTVMVTKRLFYYLAGDLMTLSAAYNGPSVYGYTYSRSYNVFTHPDGGQVTGGNGVGTYENVTQTSSNASVSPNFGQGSLDANSKVQDTLGLISSAPLPVGLRIVDTQDIGVGGFFVRNNVVTFTETGITVNSNGPSN